MSVERMMTLGREGEALHGTGSMFGVIAERWKDQDQDQEYKSSSK